MSWLDHAGVFRATVDFGGARATVPLMLTVGMDLEARHFREVEVQR
jgi:hypothetical protein